MKQQTLIFLAIAAVVGYMLYKSQKKKTAAGGDLTGGGATNPTGIIGGNQAAPVNNDQVDVNAVLYKGVKAKASVIQLQAEMNQSLPAAYPKLRTDGDFGTKTETALLAFWERSQISIAQLRSFGYPPKAAIYQSNGGSGTSAFGNFLNPFGLFK